MEKKMTPISQLLNDLTEAAGKSPDETFQGDTAGDKFYLLASSDDIMRIVTALNEAREALWEISENDASFGRSFDIARNALKRIEEL